MSRAHPRLVWATLLVLAAVLSGCVDAEDEPLDVPTDTTDAARADDGRDLRLDLRADDTLPAPAWQVGEAFGIHIILADGQEFHIETIVVDDLGGAYLLAPSDKAAAKDHAVFQYPVFGEVQKKDLSANGFGALWDLYDFPLQEGKTWSAKFTVPSFDMGPGTEHDVTFTASYADAIVTPEGKRPGFQIQGKTAEGAILLDYDYVPAIGYYAHFYLYDLTTEDAADYLFHVMNMGHQYNWTGTYYIDAATVLIQDMQYTGVEDSEAVPPVPVVTTDRLQKFTMTDDATYLYGYVFSFAFAGASKLVVVDPTGDASRQYDAGLIRQGSNVDQFDFQMTFIDEAAIPGEWQALFVGAGVAAGEGAFLWEITENEYTL